jgi:glycerol-3-phosphate O-acyltransferase
MKYVDVMMNRGHPIEFFIEGGRSRTGRLLRPRTGMLGMTVRSYLRDTRRPVAYVPVYFGYDKLLEGEAYIDELMGRPKDKESVGGLLGVLPQLRRQLGRVHVSFGEPLLLDGMLDKVHAVGARTRSTRTRGPRGSATRWMQSRARSCGASTRRPR